MSNPIRMSYDQMAAVSKSVTGGAEEARTILAALDKEVQRMSDLWQGMAQVGFKSSYASCRKDFLRVPVILQNVGKAIKDAAETMKQAEVDAQSAINTAITN